MLTNAWKPIENCFLRDGFSFSAFQSFALPEAQYGQTFDFQTRDANAGTLHVYDGQSCPNFFGRIRIDAGWLLVEGVGSYQDEPPATVRGNAMPIEIRKRFKPLPLIAPHAALMLSGARKIAPNEVYVLHIDLPQSRCEFPMEILQFKRLEALEITCRHPGVRLNLPEGLFELTALHTLALQGSAFDVGALSSAIAQLQQLENLHLIDCNLTSLPNAIAALPRLETLDVSYNKLTTLPEEIGTLPLLRQVRARGNRFSALPTSLLSIPTVALSYPDHSLYRDTRYVTTHDMPVYDAQFRLASAPTLWAAVKRLFDAQSSDDLIKDCMLDASTRAIWAQSSAIACSVPLGASKTGGAPHWPKHLAHPADENGLLRTFYAQLNLAEIAPLQMWLPRHGMLYFFLGDIQHADGPQVIFADSQTVDLRRCEYTAQTRWIDGDVDAFSDESSPNLASEMRLQFSAGVTLPFLYRSSERRLPALTSLFLSEDRADLQRLAAFDQVLDTVRDALPALNLAPAGRSHSLNGLVWSDDETSTEQAAISQGGRAEEWINLLVLESVGDFCFGDAGTLCFCIQKKTSLRGTFRG